MSKKLLLPVIGLALCSIVTVNAFRSVSAYSPAQPTCKVDFFNNYLREEFTLSNGTKGKGNNLLYKSVEVYKESLLTKPDDPIRERYEFQGWYLETACETAWA